MTKIQEVSASDHIDSYLFLVFKSICFSLVHVESVFILRVLVVTPAMMNSDDSYHWLVRRFLYPDVINLGCQPGVTHN